MSSAIIFTKGVIFMSEIEWIKIFGDNLREMLEEECMSQRDLSEETGLSIITINRYINKQQMPTIKAVLSISYALNCNVSDLIDFGDRIEM